MLNSEHINRSLSLRYSVALGLIAILATLGFLIMEWNLAAKKEHASLINVSGQQRMLSQATALWAGEMYFGRTEPERINGEAKLRELSARFRDNHEELKSGLGRFDAPSIFGPAVEAAYFEIDGLDDMVNRYLGMIDTLLAQAAPDDQLRDLMNDMSELAANDLVEGLDNVVALYEAYADETLAHLAMLHKLVYIATLMLLAFEVIFIFRPVTKRLGAQADAISDMARDLAVTARNLAATKDEMEGLVTAIAHDLRGPSNAIRGLADWLAQDLDGQIDETSHALLVRLRERSHRFERLLTDLLRFCRAADTEDRPGVLEVESLEEEVMADVFLPDGVEVAFEGRLPGTTMQVGSLVVVVRQLVTSALRRQAGDEGRIEVMLGLREGRNRAVVAEVVDPAPAVPAALATPGDTASVGFDLVNKIVTARGGTLDIVESGEDGTRLRLIWPLHTERGTDSRVRMVMALDKLDKAMLRAARDVAPALAAPSLSTLEGVAAAR